VCVNCVITTIGAKANYSYEDLIYTEK